MSGLQCSSDRLDNSTGDCWVTIPLYSVSLMVNPVDERMCLEEGWDSGRRRCSIILNEDSSVCDTVKYFGKRMHDAQYLGLSCLQSGSHNVSVLFWDSYGALIGELWSMLR